MPRKYVHSFPLCSSCAPACCPSHCPDRLPCRWLAMPWDSLWIWVLQFRFLQGSWVLSDLLGADPQSAHLICCRCRYSKLLALDGRSLDSRWALRMVMRCLFGEQELSGRHMWPAEGAEFPPPPRCHPQTWPEMRLPCKSSGEP